MPVEGSRGEFGQGVVANELNKSFTWLLSVNRGLPAKVDTDSAESRQDSFFFNCNKTNCHVAFGVP
jgi:hypothetical protein